MRIQSRDIRRVPIALALGAVGAGVSSQSLEAQERKGDQASQVEYDGWRQYMVNCARCHGDDAVGGVMAPDLRGSVAKGAVDRSSFHSVVSGGRPAKGMPAFEKQLSGEQIAAIFAYVSARAEGRLAAGRPKVR
ncbi:MAG TPA: cytochrome c [Gemmatimonadaceae bacterium]